MLLMIDFSTPLAGLDRAESKINQVASELAHAGTATTGAPGGDTVDLSAEMVSLLQARNDYSGNLKIIQSEDDMNKSLLNVLG